MNRIAEIIYSKNGLRYLGGVSDEDIKKAEIALGLDFSDDYKLYLKEFGVASWEGVELTGICQSNRLSVVYSTMALRDRLPCIPKDLYVIEELGVDGIIITANQLGEVYQVSYDGVLSKVSATFCEYLLSA